MLVAAAAEAAAGDDDPLAGDGQVVGRAVLEAGLRAGRDADDQRLARRAVAERALPVARPLRLPVRLALEGLQVAQGAVAQQHDVAAAAAVAAVGPAPRDVGLTAEAEAAVSACPALHEDARLVGEHPDRMTRPHASGGDVVD